MLARFPLPTVLIAAFLSIATTEGARGSFQNGNELFEDCQRPTGSFGKAYCMGFVGGVADAMKAAQAAGGSLAGWNACVPLQVTLGQAMDVAVNFLARHPELRHYQAVSLVAHAFEDAFPCPPVSTGPQRRS
jgi:hypothetical protein